jgi:hypothetical protein
MSTSFVVSSSDGCCIGKRGNIDYLPGHEVDISDLVYFVDFSFVGGPPPPCLEEADLVVDDQLDISDIVYLVDYMFTDGPEPTQCPPLGGLYDYTAFNSSGVAVVQGTLDLFIAWRGLIIGSWHLEAIGDPGQVGPQIGEGVLQGNTYPNDSLSIGLNPYLIDANVYLEGTMSDSAFSGQWFYYGFPGLLSQGTFTAFRR